MNFKKLAGAVLVGVMLVVGAATAEAKSRVSSKPSSYSSRSVTKAATVQRSSYSAPKAVTSTTNVRNVTPSRPSVSRSAPQRTTVIQKNYYGGNSGYNRGGSYGNGGYGGGVSGGSGLGTSIVGGAVGAAGGMLLMDALTEDEGEKALKLQQEQIKIEEARAQQERDDTQEQILENQKEEELRDEVAAEPFFQLNPELIPAK